MDIAARPYWLAGEAALVRRRRRRPRATDRILFPAMSTQTLQRWICESCGYIYDPDDGDPDGGIPAGTAFENVPDTWFCPVCGARKRDFVPYED
jgi:rubredoxin